MGGVGPYLTSNCEQNSGEVVILNLSVLHPWREPAEFAIVSIVGHPHLRANEKDFGVVDYNSAIVDDVLVHNWPASISVTPLRQVKLE